MSAQLLAGKKVHKAGGWMRVVLLLLAIAFLGPAVMRPADDNQPVAPSRPIMGEIMSHDVFSYRVGVSAWLTQRGGTFPIVTPVEVRTANSYCRLAMESDTLLQGGPASEFHVSRTADGSLLLHVHKGSVLYALAEGAVLKITAGKAKHTACAGEAQTAQTSTQRPVFAYAAHSGIVVVKENYPPELHNLKGRLVVLQEGERSTVVPAGQMLRVGAEATVDSPETALSSVASAAASLHPPIARSVGSWYVFQPDPSDVVNLGPDLVVLPHYNSPNGWPPTAPPPQVRQRMSPWLPPGRRRANEPTPPPAVEPPAQPPWIPPARR